ncbi:hypothetical protein [Nesterenkonia halotolerans]|uniref:Uncharacterized protein n=1 Tax=Nesterenkonia halotolerans TaxID=225325 RepID=A0ABR9J5N7_9MICC|nr:hypothetical protein [Nesterenkonia halotolerans]MBE1514312.1 hypothetical protein [Nesterenkonia halotolerans]
MAVAAVITSHVRSRLIASTGEMSPSHGLAPMNQRRAVSSLSELETILHAL